MSPSPTHRDAAKQAEKDLDDALRDTFPASDPIAFTPQQAGKDAHHLSDAPRSRVGDWWRHMLARIGARERH